MVLMHTGDKGLLRVVALSIQVQKGLVSYPSCVPEMWAQIKNNISVRKISK